MRSKLDLSIFNLFILYAKVHYVFFIRNTKLIRRSKENFEDLSWIGIRYLCINHFSLLSSLMVVG